MKRILLIIDLMVVFLVSAGAVFLGSTGGRPLVDPRFASLILGVLFLSMVWLWLSVSEGYDRDQQERLPWNRSTGAWDRDHEPFALQIAGRLDDDKECGGEETMPMTDVSAGHVYRHLLEDQRSISSTDFERDWNDHKRVIHFIERNYVKLSQKPAAQLLILTRLAMTAGSNTKKVAEKGLDLLKRLISEEKPELAHDVPQFFAELDGAAMTGGRVFWSAYALELLAEMVEWLEGNPYRYALYQFWIETGLYDPGEITEDDLKDGRDPSLRPIYEAARADYEAAGQKLEHLHEDDPEYGLYHKMHCHAGRLLKYFELEPGDALCG